MSKGEHLNDHGEDDDDYDVDDDNEDDDNDDNFVYRCRTVGSE